MNHQLQPRTDLVPRHADPVCAFSGLYGLQLCLPAPPSNASMYIRFNELEVQQLSPNANSGHPAHQKQLHHIQLP